MLSASGICVLKNHARLIADIDLEVSAGEIVSIIGANGAGKTTLLRALLGEVAVHSGRVTLDGVPIDQISLAERAKRVGVLSQHTHLQFPLLAAEVVALGRMPHASGAEEDQRIVAEAMSLLDVAYLANRPFTWLSGGEQQRVHLARVLAQIWPTTDSRNRLLVLDEPTVSLDLGHKQSFMAVIKRFADEGAAVLMVEHDLRTVANFSDRVLALACGEVVASGAATNVITPETIFKLFNAEVDVIDHHGQLIVVDVKKT